MGEINTGIFWIKWEGSNLGRIKFEGLTLKPGEENVMSNERKKNKGKKSKGKRERRREWGREAERSQGGKGEGSQNMVGNYWAGV